MVIQGMVYWDRSVMIRLAVLLKVTCCYNSDILVGRIMMWLEECSSVVTRLCCLRLQLLLRFVL